jgi:3-deoxy-D-manno-octulosonic-acid transferase
MLWRAVYCLATWLALPLVFVYFAWRGRREPAYRRHWGERLGRIGEVPHGALWIHAASVGEMVLAAPFVKALRQRHADWPLLITTMTPTGRERAEREFGNAACIRYMPLDTLGATGRFMRRAAPRAGVLVETELWPNLLAAAAAANVPVALVNASVSQRSAARYGRWPLRGATRFMLSRMAAIGAASESHAQRFASLGAPVERIEATGNLKYDTVAGDDLQAAGRQLRAEWGAAARPVWTAASTHEGEESLLLDAFERLRHHHEHALLVIAPRHPQRFDAVAELLDKSGWSFARRSTGETVDETTDIVLADTLGEVPLFYAAADVAFVGGSGVPGIGGHNVIEPAAAGRPLCVGPHIQEWQEIVDALVACGGARIGRDAEELADAVGGWLNAPEQARVAGRAAQAHVASQSGALKRTLALLERRLFVSGN